MSGVERNSGFTARRYLLPILILLLLIVFVLWFSGRRTPIGQSRIARTFPAQASFMRSLSQPVLLLFTSPNADDLDRQLHQLDQLANSVNLKPSVVFFDQNSSVTDLASSPAAKRTQADGRFRVIFDDRGNQTRAFGVVEPGQVVLYDNRGDLVYEEKTGDSLRPVPVSTMAIVSSEQHGSTSSGNPCVTSVQ